MTAYERRAYPGAAAETTLNGGITSGSTSLTVATGTGVNYPATGPTFLIIGYDLSSAEKVTYATRTGDTFSGLTRGVDGTTAQSHSDGAKVRAVWTAIDADEANQAVVNTVGLGAAKGDLLAGTAAHTLTRVAAAANGSLLVTDTAQSAGIRWDGANWTSYTPTVTNVTGGVFQAAYKLLAVKTLLLRCSFTAGSVTANSPVTVSLPSGLSVTGLQFMVGYCGNFTPPATVWTVSGTALSATLGSAGQGIVGDGFTGVIEVA